MRISGAVPARGYFSPWRVTQEMTPHPLLFIPYAKEWGARAPVWGKKKEKKGAWRKRDRSLGKRGKGWGVPFSGVGLGAGYRFTYSLPPEI